MMIVFRLKLIINLIQIYYSFVNNITGHHNAVVNLQTGIEKFLDKSKRNLKKFSCLVTCSEI